MVFTINLLNCVKNGSCSPPSGFPTWAIVLICVGSILIITICALLGYLARRRITRLEAEIVNVRYFYVSKSHSGLLI